MSVTWATVLVALLVALVTWLYLRSWYFKNKLQWVGIIPAYPVLGIAFQLADPLKSLYVMHNYLQKFNGLCYTEILGRPFLAISNYQFLEWLLSSNTLLTKSKDYQFLSRWLTNGILITDGAQWKKSRRILTPSFHFAVLEQFVDVFEKPTTVLINLLNKEIGKDSVDIFPYVTKYTLDVICQTSMGVQLDVQKGSHTDYVDAVAGMCQIVVERAFNPLKTSDFCYRFTFDYYREQKYVKLLHEVSNNVIRKRKEELDNNRQGESDSGEVGTKKKMAFLDLLLNYRDQDGQPLSHEFIRQEVDTFMFAGHDTIASAISFALYCLANNPDAQAKAYAEIKDVLEETSKITYWKLQELKYLELVIKETLRLYPSVPFYSRQTTDDVVYEGKKTIPKGVTLAIIAYSVNRDPKVYVDPDKFDPNRFLEGQIKPFSYLPFSAGSRNCIGQKFAMLEMKSSLAKLLLNFEFLPAIPKHHVTLAAETVLKSKNGIKIRFNKRT